MPIPSYLQPTDKTSFISASPPQDLRVHFGKREIHRSFHTSNLRFVQKQLGYASINMSALYVDVLPEQNQFLTNAILE